MKTTTILLTCFTALATLNASATIWRVNNTGIPADFASLQAAHDAITVSAGDTLHVEPSVASYGDLTASKALVIFGPGYFLSENANQQANPISASLPNITLNAGCNGTVISGMTISGSVYVNTGVITVRRNYVGAFIYLSRDVPYDDIIISGNYIINGIAAYGSSNVPLITNVLILNNSVSSISLSTQFSGIMANNIVSNNGNAISNYTIKNNIFLSANFACITGGSNSIYNNLSDSSVGLPAGNGNQNGVMMATVFVGTGSTDGQWQLAVGSPAIGAGLDGEDCGMYGGNSPYHLSGLPVIPSIYFLSGPTNSNGSTLPITVSVKSNN